MKNSVLITIITVIAMSLSLYAQEKDTTQAESQIKLELVWEKEFESPVLNFSLTEMNGIPTLEVVITTDKVQFFTGKNVKEIQTKSYDINWLEGWLFRLLCSKNGDYIGIRKDHYGDYGRIQEGSEFQVYNKIGNLLTTRKVTNNYQPFALMNNGAFLVTGVLEDASIALEQLNGAKEVIFDYPDMRPSTYMDIAEKGDRFVLNIAGIGIILYSDTGKEIWQKKFAWGDAANVRISDNGKYIGAVGILSGGGMHFLSSNGSLLWKYPLDNYYNFYLNCMDFSPDEEYFAANIYRDDIYLFESSTGKILWNYKLEQVNSSRKFFSIGVARNGEFVAAADGGGTRELPAGDSSTVFLFDKKGNIVWKKQLMIQKQKAPNVRFINDGKYFLICNDSRLYCYKITGGGQ